MDIQSVIDQIHLVVTGPSMAAILGQGPLRAIKKETPGGGYQPILIALLDPELSEDEEIRLRRGFAKACEEHDVYLLCSATRVDATFLDETDGMRLLVRSEVEGKELNALLEEYQDKQRAQGLEIEIEVYPWR